MFISLGSNCAPAYNLNKYNLRKQAYPFDWCKITLNQLCNVLENKFNNYSNVNIKKYSENHNSYIVINRYNIHFAHEIKEIKNIDLFRQKLNRRIERFYNLVKPIFIRIETKNLSSKQMNKYERLINILDKYFIEYKIILISKNNILFTSDKIEWYKLDNFSEDWKYPNIEWKNILYKYNKL